MRIYVFVCVCVCVSERQYMLYVPQLTKYVECLAMESERESARVQGREIDRECVYVCMCVYVFVYVCERESERERERVTAPIRRSW